MNTKTITRPADISAEDAKAQLREAGFEIISLELCGTSGEKIAAADAIGRTDLIWEATVKIAEFPFDKDGENEGDKSEGDSPEDTETPEVEETPDSDDADADEGEGDSDKGDSKDEVLDLVKQIAKHLGIPVPGEDDPLAEPMGDEASGLDLPDVGAPAPHEAIDEPLPLPVEKKAPGAGGGVFSSHVVIANSEAIAGRRSFVAVIEGANTLNDGEIINEARIAFPGYRVASRIDRVTLAAQNEARVPMVAEAKVN